MDGPFDQNLCGFFHMDCPWYYFKIIHPWPSYYQELDGGSYTPPRNCNNRGVTIQSTTCLSCNSEEETVANLFFNCIYTRKVILELTKTLDHAIWKLQNRLIPDQSEENRLSDITEIIQRFTANAIFWGIQWALLGYSHRIYGLKAACLETSKNYYA